jgi:transcriptional regulator with XRE-family HTH domain
MYTNDFGWVIISTGVMTMTLGQKIKTIRNFRNLTQKQLGMEMGFNESNADVRIRQYESDDKSPRKDNLARLAKILRVNPVSLTGGHAGTDEHIIQTLFWLDESSPGLINLIQLDKIPRKKGAKLNPEHRENDISVRYHDSDDWPVFIPMCIWFKKKQLNEYINEWLKRKRELNAGKITRDDYFEWKLNWPRSCGNGGEKDAKA